MILTPLGLCPYCEYKLDAATGANTDALPEEGDWTVCIDCAGLLLFDKELKLRCPTPMEKKHMEQDPEIVKVLGYLKQIHKRELN